MHHKFLKRVAAFGVVAGASLAASSAHAQLIINPTFDSTILALSDTATVQATINQAIGVYQSKFTNPITVRITFAGINTGLGQSSTAIFQESYANVRTALAANANTANALAAVTSLPTQANSPVDGNLQMWVTSANARALGFTAVTASDATVSFNFGLTNDGSPFNQDPNKYSLLAVAEHEIDEVLGLGSGLNLPTNFPRLSRVQDLFRYSAPGVRAYSTSTGAPSYFSVNGGITNLVGFNQTGNADYGDWVSSATPRVQDAFGSPGSNEDLLTDGGVELINLNAQGYFHSLVSVPNGTPEPGTFALLAVSGVFGMGAAVRRRRSAKK